MKLLTAAEMAAMDRQATEQYAIPSLVLMENAGRAVATVADRAAGGLRGQAVAVFCGKGNNGGDGLVAARHLLRAGARPRVFVIGSFQDLKGDARKNLDMATRAGVKVSSLSDTAALEAQLGVKLWCLATASGYPIASLPLGEKFRDTSLHGYCHLSSL